MLRLLMVLALTAFAVPAQMFDAASVRRSRSGETSMTRLDLQHPSALGRVEYFHVNLKTLLMVAYGVGPDQIGGPPWLTNEHYDILAKIPDGVLTDQVPAMLRNLLGERFEMKLHEVTLPRKGFALLADHSGRELKLSKPDSQPHVDLRLDRILVTHCAIGEFAQLLSSVMDRPIQDLTGIEGHYDITLMASRADLKAAASTGEHSSGSIFTALRELGLRLEPRTVPALNIIVDHANKIPTEN